MTYSRWQQLKPEDFKRLCGVHHQTFARMVVVLKEQVEPQKKKPGRPRKLSLEDQIGKKFQNVNQALGGDFDQSLESAKWELWHGKAEVALAKLALIREDVTDSEKKASLKGLWDYLKSNQDYLVNYEQRQQAGQTYTSQVAESHIESLINARHKRTGKMQWTREGAHQVLQIRAIMASNHWEEIGTKAVLSALVA